MGLITAELTFNEHPPKIYEFQIISEFQIFVKSSPHSVELKKTIHTTEQQVFIQLLKETRITKPLTQQELASALGVHQSRVSDYERGERQMDIIELYTYLQAMNVSLNDFVIRLVDGLESIEKKA